VALHAALQWWGARRVGVRLRPLPGWRDPDVMNVVRRAVRSVLQAGLLALQLLAVLLAANRAAGGTVALQIAFNFYYLPLALVATPVALALLPRLSRLTPDRGAGLTGGQFTDTYRQGLGLALFLVVPAACGYVVLSGPVAHVVAVGQMNSPAALTMLAGCLAVLAVGLAGETTFFVTTQACYARRDTRTPLVSMSVQAAVCLLLAGLATLADPHRVPLLAGGAYAAASLVGGAHLFLRSRRQFGPGRTRLWPSAVRIAAGALVMAGPVYLVAHRLGVGFAGGLGELAAVLVATLTGLLLYALVQAALRAPELTWLLAAVRRHRDVKAPEAAL
jgi:putative peptidoglycan lipid II flippase